MENAVDANKNKVGSSENNNNNNSSNESFSVLGDVTIEELMNDNLSRSKN